MRVYWSILFVTFLCMLLSYSLPRKKKIQENEILYKTNIKCGIINICYIIFWVGFRDYVLDTYYYVATFKAMPTTWSGIITYVDELSTSKGFYLIQGIFKKCISQSHYAWFFFLGGISCYALFKIIYKYSVDFSFSIYIFVTASTFTWLLNGMRQFLVVSLLFGCTGLLIKGEKKLYIIIALFLSSIHVSAIIIVFVALFIDSKKIFSKRIIIFGMLAVIGTYYSEKVFSFISVGLGQDYTVALNTGEGANVINFFIAIVPLVIVCLNYHNVVEKAPEYIVLAINMQFIGACFYFAATFTNGILVGRMPIYFTVYNLYLLPWVIENCFTEKSKKFVWSVCMILYLIIFYYQMECAWGGLEYVSEILGVNL